MNKEKFYDTIRPSFPLTTENVQGFEKVLDYLLLNEDNLNQAAYILATVWWETANTMQPIQEYGSLKYLKSKKYYPYFGRGYVQLTWKENYQRASKVFGVDFVKHPDLVKDPVYALPILFVGMNDGWFGPKGLDEYIDGKDESDSEDLREFKAARRTVNIQDKAEAIGKIALIFERALKAADYKRLATKPVKAPDEPVTVVIVEAPTKTPEIEETPVQPSMGFLEALLKLIISAFTGRKSK